LDKNWIIHQFAVSAGPKKKMLIDYLASFKETIDKMMKDIEKTAHPDDHVQLIIFSDNTDWPVSTKYIKFRHFDASYLLTVLMASAQSGHSLEFDHNIQLHVKHVLTGKRSKNSSSLPFRGGRTPFGEISSTIEESSKGFKP